MESLNGFKIAFWYSLLFIYRGVVCLFVKTLNFIGIYEIKCCLESVCKLAAVRIEVVSGSLVVLDVPRPPSPNGSDFNKFYAYTYNKTFEWLISSY